MLSKNAFDVYNPGPDKYANQKANLKLDDLQPAFDGQPKVSYLISTYNRQWQLARSLETLARQTFREFEVLLTDDSSTQDIAAIAGMFRPYLQIHYFKQDRPVWRSCPSRAFKRMVQEAQGEVIAIAHPEIMLDFRAMDLIWKGCNGELTEAEAFYWSINNAPTWGNKYWVSLKPQFLADDTADSSDWHTHNLTIFSTNPGFANIGGFSAKPNSWHAARNEYPWWFAGATKKEHKLWESLPELQGHGVIDMWLCSYRLLNGYTEVVPLLPLAYHQPHLTSAVGVAGEQEDPEKQARKVE